MGPTAPRPTRPRALVTGLLVVVVVTLLSGCGAAGSPASAHGRILAVGAENEYANVISQIGGRYVEANAVMSNPNTDPHTFEASPSVARTVASARLIVQNGVGYDSFMSKIEGASHDASRKVIDVQDLLHLPSSTLNPHLWYSPRTMPAVAHALAADLSGDPARPRRLLPRQRGPLHRLSGPVDACPGEVLAPLPGHDGGHHRTGRRLHAPSRRGRQPDPVLTTGRHHERNRSGPAGG